MKKLIALIMGAVMCLGLCGCNSNGSDGNSASGNNTDWNYIKNKGEAIIGITYYEPMNYLDENGELTGFETEFTKAVCEKLGVTPKFQVIDWKKKEIELKSKTIDLIWNGLTVTDERRENMAFSTTYLKNRQVVIIKKDNAEKYTDTKSMAGASVAFEAGSAGEDAANADDTLKDCKQIGCDAQKDAVLEVKAGTAEIGIVDYTLARSAVDSDDFSDLMILESVQLMDEDYAVGVRLEDTETLAKINQAIDELAKDGTLLDLAKKYGVDDIYAL
ncbi:MAG: transporter substrate-binding domain-containing protein [Oscillospiraceae bacterium]|nr:transporter substrate-binding domain-containing protein [Oscillospiraceae bacterium]